MVLPIYLLGTTELRRITSDVRSNSVELRKLVDDMLETMAEARGIGLAAPQVGRSERVFVVDITPLAADHYEAADEIPDQPMVFINARMLDESEDAVSFEEGCLSIPDIHEEVNRSSAIRIQYRDRNFEKRTEEFDGLLARVIQHEYDHVDGVLFIDHITAFRRRLLKRKLKEIMDGEIETEYPIFAEGKGVLMP